MPNWRLRFSDDFSGYANQTEMEAAYVPGLFNDPTGVYFVNWGATNSPDGDEGAVAVWDGVHKELQDLSRDVTGRLEKPLFASILDGGALEGVEFKVVVRLDNSLDFVRIQAYWLDEPSVGNDDLTSSYWNVYSGKAITLMSYGDMAVQRQNNGGPSLSTSYYAGACPVDTPQTITIEFKLSSTNDGYLIVKRDSTTVHSATGINLYDNGYDLLFNYIEVSPGGKIGLLEVYDTSSAPPDPDPGELTASTPEPCCGSGGGGSATGPILPAIVPTWEEACTGGGTVPTAADLTDAENWDD